jgi:hypothetical protein
MTQSIFGSLGSFVLTLASRSWKLLRENIARRPSFFFLLWVVCGSGGLGLGGPFALKSVACGGIKVMIAVFSVEVEIMESRQRLFFNCSYCLRIWREGMNSSMQCS